jgi:phosphopantetheine adenylyltransferase
MNKRKNAFTQDNRQDMIRKLSAVGFNLSEVTPVINERMLLVQLLKQDDMRLIEGYPIVLRSVLQDIEKNDYSHWVTAFCKMIPNSRRPEHVRMLIISYLLFKLFGEPKEILRRVEDLLKHLSGDLKEHMRVIEKSFNESGEINLTSKQQISIERIKTQYRNYVVLQARPGLNAGEQKQLELELKMSEFFTPKQKELITKRKSGQPLSKTEREYFYRVVSKRLKALGDRDLHLYARSLLT